MSSFCSIESQYENCSHLEVRCQPGVLIPNQTMQVEILFYPRESRRYHEIIPFEINGLSTMNVEIFGEGTDMKVSCSIWVVNLDLFMGVEITVTYDRYVRLIETRKDYAAWFTADPKFSFILLRTFHHFFPLGIQVVERRN